MCVNVCVYVYVYVYVQVRLEESEWLGAGLLVPADGFSAEVVRGVPPGLAEFVAPLQRGGLCRLAHQPHAPGAWTVYMAHPQPARPAHPRAQPPRLHIVHLHKNHNGMGLSIVVAKVSNALYRVTRLHLLQLLSEQYVHAPISFIEN